MNCPNGLNKLMEAKKMKLNTWILVCYIWISTCSAIQGDEKTAIATLPDKTTIAVNCLRILKIT